MQHPFIILCPSFDQPRGGFTPKPVEKFLEQHGHWLVGVLGAGNLNFGEHFCQAAKDISAQHNVPVLHRIDIMGNENDYEVIDRGVKQHWGTLLNMKGLA